MNIQNISPHLVSQVPLEKDLLRFSVSKNITYYVYESLRNFSINYYLSNINVPNEFWTFKYGLKCQYQLNAFFAFANKIKWIDNLILNGTSFEVGLLIDFCKNVKGNDTVKRGVQDSTIATLLKFMFFRGNYIKTNQLMLNNIGKFISLLESQEKEIEEAVESLILLSKSTK